LAPEVCERAWRAFGKAFGPRRPEGVAVAPGRVNLIGEHTDYNDGFVLPAAIDRYLAAAFASNKSRVLRVYSEQFGEAYEVPLDRHAEPSGSWVDYVAGVARMIADSGAAVDGIDLAIAADLPVEAGLSSSAALELATARAIAAAAGVPWDSAAAAQICQLAENTYVGVQCGIMDQLVVATAVAGCALLIDCRDLSSVPVPIPTDLRMVVMDTGVPRGLAVSGYNDRRSSCRAAVDRIRGMVPEVRSLRDVTGELLERARPLLDPVEFKRAQHVVAETARPGELAQALRDRHLSRCRRLMMDSHWSLRDLYEVSSPELDVITGLAAAHPGCLGARMTGAGFGGSAIALVKAEQAEAFAEEVRGDYLRHRDGQVTFHVCRPVSGVDLCRAPGEP
jgi:galactokinase